MRLIFYIVLCLFACAANAVEMSLADKIAMAKKMADDASAGKIASGLVVDSTLNMGDVVKRYRDAQLQSRMGESLSSALEEAGKEEELPDVSETLKKEAKVEAIKKPRSQAKEDVAVERISPTKKTKIKDASDSEVLPIVTKPEKSVAEKIETKAEKTIAQDNAERSVKKRAEVEKATSKKPESILSEPKREEKIAEIPKIIPPKKEKLVPVDTSKNFINGHYVGEALVDSKGKKIDIAKLEKKEVYEFRDAAFTVFSDDSQALSRATAVITECTQLLKRYFSKGDALALRRPIELRIISKDGAEKIPQVGAKILDNGEIILSAKWDENLELSAFCRLLSGGALRAIAYYYGGTEGVKKVPYWFELAFEGALEQSVRFGVVTDMARLAEDNPPENIQKILNFRRGNIGDFNLARAQAYWNMEALSRMEFNFTDFLFAEALSKPDVNQIYNSLCGRLKSTPQNLEIRWRNIITGLIYSRLGGIQSFETTLAEIKRFAILPVFKDDGTVEGLAGMALFENRDSPGVEDALNARVFEIKVALTKANPVYHNCLISLGRAYEAVIDGDESAYRSCLTDFGKELKTSNIIADKSRQLLNAPSLEDNQSKEESVNSAKK